MNPTRAKYVKQLLGEYQADPPSRDEIEYVVADFNHYFSFAMETLEPHIRASVDAARDSDGSQPKQAAVSNTKPVVNYFESIEPSGDPEGDLNRLDPYQIATALEQDHPKTIALVLRKLNTPLAAAVLEELPEAPRADAVVFMSQESTVPEKIVHQVLQSTFQKANTVTCRKQQVDQAQVLAELMRSLPKPMRNQLIERLQEEDQELVAVLRSKLYVFEDLMRLDDRDVQKILGEVETDILIVALQKAVPELVKRLLNNLSKRARQTIEEEMEYKSNVDPSEIQEARQKLVEALGRLDESGDVTLN
jgi:flagellar motor switch protein FliG